MIEKNIRISFREDDIPVWPCPNCNVESLSYVDNSFSKNYKKPFDVDDPRFSPMDIEYIFSMNLRCINVSCRCGVVCVGVGDVAQEYLNDGTNDWGWFDDFTISYFEPPLNLFVSPKDTPDSVKDALIASFSTFFNSPSNSLANLRAALEILLSEMGISTLDENGKFISLAARINCLSDEYKKIVEPANAIRWLGNDSIHTGRSRVCSSDVIDGYNIFSHILRELYPEKRASIEDLVDKINKNKGIGQ